MALIKKEVTGVAENLKLVKNGKTAPTTPAGGTHRPKFTGSSDNRTSGDVNSNKILKDAPGYIDQGATYIGDTSHSRSFTKAGNRGSLAGQVRVASEDVTGGMGGKFWKEPS